MVWLPWMIIPEKAMDRVGRTSDDASAEQVRSPAWFEERRTTTTASMARPA
jgi:hypothetical protein